MRIARAAKNSLNGLREGVDDTGDLNLSIYDAEENQMRPYWQHMVASAEVVAFGDAFGHRG